LRDVTDAADAELLYNSGLAPITLAPTTPKRSISRRL
jgi:hypothetical protein